MLNYKKITSIQAPHASTDSEKKIDTSPTSIATSVSYSSTEKLLSQLSLSPENKELFMRSRSTSTPSFPINEEETGPKMTESAKYLTSAESLLRKRMKDDAKSANELVEKKATSDDESMKHGSDEESDLIFPMDV